MLTIMITITIMIMIIIIYMETIETSNKVDYKLRV